MADTAMTSAVGYLFWLVAAHLYNPTEIGLAVAVISASTVVMLVSWIGVGGALIQSLPGESDETGWSATFWTGMATAVIFAVVGSGIALGVLPLFSPKLTLLRSIGYAAVFVVGTVALAAGATLDWVYIAERRAKDMFSRNAIASAVKVVMLGVLALTVGPGALRLLGAWCFASVFGLGLGAILLVRYRRVVRLPAFSVLRRTASRLRARVTGNQVIGIATGVLPYLLPLLVTVRLSTSDNAYFYTAWMLAGLLRSIAPAVSMSLFAEGVHRPNEVGAMARSAAKIIGVLLAPILVAILAVGGILLSTLGQAYADHATDLLRIIALASIPDAVTCVYASMLRAQGKLATVAFLYVGIGCGTLIMCWLLLPLLGIEAVGWALMAVQLCACIYVALHWLNQRSPNIIRLS
ncbi:hypothetical protein C0J29_13120 [Mycobacterium paragordonae]|nr:hypothetical protein [Mycobacterium paragordonae]AYE95593.1 hypothetical protein C0J29_13120 [Mycobacterium paragordonae]